jgi:penicillin-binding protein 1A
MDAWFVGYQPTLVAAVWVGYDNPRNLGSRETGGGLSLPIWISFMSEALKNAPVEEVALAPGVVFTHGEWFYDEFVPGSGLRQIEMSDEETGPVTGVPPEPGSAAEEKRSILDLFKN